MGAAFADAEALNERAVPMGYAVLTTASGDSSHYVVHPLWARDDRSGDRSFPDIAAAAEYVDHLEMLPWWTLDLSDESIDVDGVAETVTDRRTGESIHVGGKWRTMIGGARKSGQTYGEAVSHLSVRADEPPTIGNWRKSSH